MPSYQRQHEASWLLNSGNVDIEGTNHHEAPTQGSSTTRSRTLQLAVMSTLAFVVVFHGVSFLVGNPSSSTPTTDYIEPNTLTHHVVDLWGKKKKKEKHHKHHDHGKFKKKNHGEHITLLSKWTPPPVEPRCDFVMNTFAERDAGTPPDDLRKRYLAQSEDANVFYRATAHIFWKDFALEGWGHGFTPHYLLHNDPDSEDSDDDTDEDPDNIQQLDGVPLTSRSVWTWVTGDQHLSNFGAWRNRHGDVVFGVNDFDEGAISDFQIDIIRIGTSIASHAITNGLEDEDVDIALMVFAESYVKTILNYQDNEEAALFEITPKNAYGKLQDFLEKVEKKDSSEKQMTKYTTENDLGKRHFIKGPVDVPHEKTKLATVPPAMAAEIKQAFNETHYGATMMKLGWAVLEWDDDFFEVLDVAERIGSGIGSFGVDRYYVLLKGEDGLLRDDGEDGTAVILDVKYQPPGAVTYTLTEETAAWYDTIFPHDAARVVEAQRRLTSYTDPFLGWVMLRNLDPNDETFGQDRAFSVRQRSPWKDSPDLEDYSEPEDFFDFVAQIAAATATSHTRGTVAKAPGDFKNVIAAVLGGSKRKREEWGETLAIASKAYRKQVLMDFKCFQDYVFEHYGNATASDDDDDDDTE